MKKFMVMSFIFLGWAFYEMSGGADFKPAVTAVAPADVEQTALKPGAARSGAADDPATAAPDSLPHSTDGLTLASLGKTFAATNGLSKSRKSLANDTVLLMSSERASAQPTPATAPVATASAAAPAETPVIATEPEKPQLVPVKSADIRQVSGSRVNLRGGPGTTYRVLESLTKGTRVQVLDEPGNGWIKLTPIDGGPVGWMADYLVAAVN